MHDAEDVSRIHGHRRDKSILKYLRTMISFSRSHHRGEMVWYYEQAWEFASSKIYGALPPRKEDLAGTFYKPDNPLLPGSFRPPKNKQPLRTIVKNNDHPHGYTTIKWEFLECGHELMAYPGYSNPAKQRRCIYCAFVQAQAKALNKKPAVSVDIEPRKKAVSA